jgi:hypothetical protein
MGTISDCHTLKWNFPLVPMTPVLPVANLLPVPLTELSADYTVMPLSGITVALFPVWKLDRGQLLFNAKEIECVSCNAENCRR